MKPLEKVPMTKNKIKKKISFSRKDRQKEILMCVLFLLILWLFYKSVYALLLWPVIVFIYHRFYKKQVERQNIERLNLQFKDALVSITAALRAGHSIENAIRESLSEMTLMYGDSSLICTEFKKMVNKLSLGFPAEEVFLESANESKAEDIETFAEVFSIAKRTGGNMTEIIKKTSDDITAKADTKNEINVLIAAKRLEKNIMCLMPIAMILFIDFTAKDLLSPLYGNIKGVVIMSAALAIYAGAYVMAGKIIETQV